MHKTNRYKPLFSILSYVLLLLIFFFPVRQFCSRKTAGFSLFRIQSNFAYNPHWDTPELTQTEKTAMDAILEQKFHYLGKGGQCYAFESEDGKYVLKFFKLYLRRLPSWAFAIPLSDSYQKMLERKQKVRASKLERDFNSYKLAFTELKEETGLIFIHLNKTQELKKAVTIIDKLHIEHVINLDKTLFVLQKKAELVYPHLNRLMREDNKEKAKEAVQSILTLIHDRAQKGIFDEDARIHCNFGFIDNEAVLIDVGRLKIDPQIKVPAVYQKDLLKITRRFKQWLEVHHPSLATYLDEKLDEIQKNPET